MSNEKTLRDIIESSMDLYHFTRPKYAFNRVFSVGLIHDSHMELVELPEGVVRADIEYWEIREQGRRGCLESRSFMEYENRLVPLGTHTSERKPDFQMYQLDENGNETGRQPFYEFVLDRLPETVLLTRVLSEDEVNSWTNGRELGSKHELFWKQPTIHTAYHSITSEFKGSDNYSRAIMMYVDKDEIRQQIQRGNVDIATNSFLFTNRRDDSPFPFDMEFTFREGAFQTLKEGYKKWREESKVNSIENPFYIQPPSKK